VGPLPFLLVLGSALAGAGAGAGILLLGGVAHPAPTPRQRGPPVQLLAPPGPQGCPACLDAHRATGRRRTRAKALGLWQPYQPAEPVRRHVEQLRAAGLGIDQIALLAGIAGSSLRFIVYGRPSDQIKTSTAAKILGIAVTDQTRARRSTLDAAITRLHLRDLLAAGWTYPDLATQLGRSTANLRRTAKRSTVTVSTATAIAALHICSECCSVEATGDITQTEECADEHNHCTGRPLCQTLTGIEGALGLSEPEWTSS